MTQEEKVLKNIIQWLTAEIENPLPNDDTVDICVGRLEQSNDLIKYIRDDLNYNGFFSEREKLSRSFFTVLYNS